MLRIGSVILRKKPKSSVDGSYTDNDHTGIVLLGRRHCTQTFLTSDLGERNAVDIIHSFGIDMFPKFSKKPNTKSEPALPKFSVSCFHVLQVSFAPRVENFLMLFPLCSMSIKGIFMTSPL